MPRLKRSTINRNIEIAQKVFAHFGLHLPPFARWTVDDWAKTGPECDEIRECMLGWDVTDFGSGDFPRLGRTLFTLRNGKAGHAGRPKSYAEKLILDPGGQRAPAHFHRSKREDIIARGSGNIMLQLWKVGPDNGKSTEPFSVQIDGQTRHVAGGDTIRLTSGQSLCIEPRTVHQFWGEEGTGISLDGTWYTASGEVSSVCDDLADNYFLDAMTRFPAVDEDEPRRYYLCHEYPKL
jgi:D-lyxose ketol-isomerase